MKWSDRKNSETYRLYLERTKERRQQNRRAYYLENKQKEKDKNREWVKNNPDKIKANQKRASIKRLYGLSVSEYEQLAESQDYKCAICNNLSRLQVDHCHTTGKVRGLLCSPCNTGIGLLKEDEKIMTLAIEYIKKHNE